MPVSKDHITVVIPTKNEGEAVGLVLEELKQHGYDNILVVDGYSVDNTVDVANCNGGQVIFQHGRGKTGALRTAVEHVDTPYMLVMDGDHSYSAEDIGRFLDHAENYDQIIGSRIEGRESIPRLHRFGNWVITKVFNLLMGTNLSDVCSGMYLLRTEKGRGLELNSAGFDVEAEIAAQMATGGKLTEVPISYRMRVGESKLSTWRTGLGLLCSVVGLATRFNPVLLFSSVAVAALIPAALAVGWALYLNFFHGRWEFNWLLFGSILFLLGAQGLTVATISILLKRMEHRIGQRMKEARSA